MFNVAYSLVAVVVLTPAQPRTPQEVRAILAREVNFTGLEDPKTTLEEALDLLSKRYNLTIKVNEAAFKVEGIANVGATPIAEKGIPKAANIAPAKILEMVLGRVPSASKAVFLLRPQGYIEITTTRAALGIVDPQPVPEM